MERLGVITKYSDDDSSEWVNVQAFSRKASGVCLDSRTLNKATKRTDHRLPTLDGISHQLPGSTVYSKLEAKNGYWGIKLITKCNKLCISSPRR